MKIKICTHTQQYLLMTKIYLFSYWKDLFARMKWKLFIFLHVSLMESLEYALPLLLLHCGTYCCWDVLDFLKCRIIWAEVSEIEEKTLFKWNFSMEIVRAVMAVNFYVLFNKRIRKRLGWVMWEICKKNCEFDRTKL